VCVFTKSYGGLAIDEFSLGERSSDSAHGHQEFQITVIQVLAGTTELDMQCHEETCVSLSNYLTKCVSEKNYGDLVRISGELRRKCAYLWIITEVMYVDIKNHGILVRSHKNHILTCTMTRPDDKAYIDF